MRVSNSLDPDHPFMGPYCLQRFSAGSILLNIREVLPRPKWGTK